MGEAESEHALDAAGAALDNGHSRFAIAQGTIGQIRRTPLRAMLGRRAALSIRSGLAARQTEASKALLNAIIDGHPSQFINTGFIA